MIAAQRARYSKIERLVDELISSQSGQPMPPVDVERMVRARGIEIRKGPLDDDISGLLVRTDNAATIGVNAGHSPTRRRFTIAHEFGHFLLHEGISEHVDHGYRVNFRDQESSLARDVEEIEANFFAASLLMPKSLLDACDAVHAVDSDALVRTLAKRFNVSQHAMSLRLANVYRRYTPF
jgi:Zn-dependent peptidase ImmA (M78 family)